MIVGEAGLSSGKFGHFGPGLERVLSDDVVTYRSPVPRPRSLPLLVAVAVLAAGCSSGRRAAPSPTTSAAIAISTTTGPTTTGAPATTTAAAPATTASTTSPPPLRGQPVRERLGVRHGPSPARLGAPRRSHRLRSASSACRPPGRGRDGSGPVRQPWRTGVSAVEFARNARSFLPSAVLVRFDIVGVDPRGTGGASPSSARTAPDLDRYFGADPTPDDAAERQRLIDVNRQFADDVRPPGGAILLTTSTPARRRATWTSSGPPCGDRQTHLSSASPTGRSSAPCTPTCSPPVLRAAVLDGAIDPHCQRRADRQRSRRPGSSTPSTPSSPTAPPGRRARCGPTATLAPPSTG